eukprot:CAMPEP_0115040622 /NCGR_PEP_ID=MMETSP0216-20121206/44940_1 /TAXON_ID=223996 /ORGANISM="Protocruzia adherens, Strain Boccale" /LENGTH=797 /DNA_ID=CAMNT_0002421901 /DNA_START=45 /DNA_END=2439 /DNA_ORIENTATION=+
MNDGISKTSSVLCPKLEFDDRDLESRFQAYNFNMAKGGVTTISFVLALFISLSIVIDVAFTDSNLVGVILGLAVCFILLLLASSKCFQSLKMFRMCGYCIIILLVFGSFAAGITKTFVRFVISSGTCFWVSFFLIRSFRISKWMIAAVATVEIIHLIHWKGEDEIHTKTLFVINVILCWALSLTCVIYRMEVELRKTFYENDRNQSTADEHSYILTQISTGLILLQEEKPIWKSMACDSIFLNQPLELHQPFGKNWLETENNSHLKAWLSKCRTTSGECKGQFLYNDGEFSKKDACKFLEIKSSWIQWKGSKNLLLSVSDRTAEENENKFKYEWISTVSHEFRTPINIIKNMVETLKDEKNLSDIGKEFVQLGCNSTKLLQIYVGDLLDYCLLRNGKFQISSKSLDLKDLLQQCLSMLKLKADDKKIDLSLVYDEKAMSKIHSDEGRIQQVIINLLSNAIKFTPKKGRVAITVNSLSTLGDEVEIKVEDNGIGIRKEDQEGLFTEYGRVVDNETQSLNPQGVGLGLWICKQFCEKLGNGIQLESHYGRGTTFSFTVRNLDPQSGQSSEFVSVQSAKIGSPKWSKQQFVSVQSAKLISDYKSKEPESEHEEVPTSSSDSDIYIEECDITDFMDTKIVRNPGDILTVYRTTALNSDLYPSAKCLTQSREVPILIVDDEPVNRFILGHFCQKMSIPAILACDGQEAIEVVRNEQTIGGATPRFRMAIVDYQMPGIAGPQLCERLTKLHRSGEIYLPSIIGHSAFLSSTELEEFKQSGSHGILEKPTTFEAFKSIVEQFSS